MKKTIFLLVVSLALWSCGSSKKTTFKKSQSETASYKDLNNYAFTGVFKVEDIKRSKHKAWFEAGYTNFELSETEKKTLKKHLKKYEIIGFIGTWCPDSKREYPKLIKLLDEVDFESEDFKIYAVNRMKKTSEGIEQKFNIRYVPTFIFISKKTGNEVGRYVERPNENFIKDIIQIVTQQNYTPYR
ncbi:TlpA family protein disulfide reductase [uncultured Mesonia sp.]|uniref:TlpA family protein disulfide reductase n=1 Tax=uncultured Mesonia sp. TaxID=399731 RepID=UPI00374E2336